MAIIGVDISFTTIRHKYKDNYFFKNDGDMYLELTAMPAAWYNNVNYR